jgi:hypothetical protein
MSCHTQANRQGNAQARQCHHDFIFHALLPPLASALNTYAFSLPHNAGSRRDYDNSYPPLLRHDTAYDAPCDE